MLTPVAKQHAHDPEHRLASPAGIASQQPGRPQHRRGGEQDHLQRKRRLNCPVAGTTTIRIHAHRGQRGDQGGPQASIAMGCR